MKVLFLFEGLPHYYNNVLNRLNQLPNTSITVLIPSTKSTSLGKNVYQSNEDIAFKVIETDEYMTWYGKAFLRNMISILEKEKPDILVAGWPYIQGIFTNPLLIKFIKKNNIKLIEKSIPYLVPNYNEARTFYSNPKNLVNEELAIPNKIGFVEKLKYFLITQFRKYYFNKVDAHVCYIEQAIEILGSYGVPEEKIFITYNSPDTDKIFESKKIIFETGLILPPNSQRILHVGRLVKWKKVHLLIDAISMLSKQYPLIELVVVGNGPEEKALVKQVEELNLQTVVKFIGGVYDPVILGKYFTESTVYVLAGVGGLSINEAMCYEKPILCSICDGTEKSLVKEGINGHFFENDNVEDLKNKIEYFLNSPSLAGEMGKASLKIIEEKINIHTVIKGYEKAFHYVVSKS